MSEQANMAARYEREIPEGYEARIEGNKIILEQKKSEDEKIRKAIESIIRVYGKTQGEWIAGYDMDTLVVHLRDAFAYLERQKEQKSVQFKGESLAEIIKGEFEGFRNLLKKKGIDYEPQSTYWESLARLFDSSAREYLKEHKPAYWMEDDRLKGQLLWQQEYETGKIAAKQEQQPAAWSEKDKGALEDAICAADILGNDESFNKGNPNLAKAFRVAKDWLKSLPERFSLQPKQEWSEEDEKNIEKLDGFLTEVFCYGHVYVSQKDKEELQSWLKSLRPQRHKWYIKKGHWYMCIVDKPEYGWTKGKVYQSPEDNRIETDYKGDLTNWPHLEPWFRPATSDEIPDSQPHWKPSEDQIQVIYNVLKSKWGCVTDRACLLGLVNALKKL